MWVIVEYITVGGLQVLASYSSLYPAIIRSLEPFTPDLFRAFGSLTNETKLMPLSDADQLVILVLATELSAAGAARKRVWPRRLVDRVRRLTGLGASHLVDSELGRVRWAMSLDLPLRSAPNRSSMVPLMKASRALLFALGATDALSPAGCDSLI